MSNRKIGGSSSRAVIQQISETISANLVENHCFLGRNPEELPPWGLVSAYGGTVFVGHSRVFTEVRSKER